MAPPDRGGFSKRCLAVAVLGFVLGGCGGGDDDNPMKPQPGPAYPERSTPQNVLTALEIAYAARDSAMYGALHDSTYTGSSIDLNDPGAAINLTFSDEVAHIRALASTPGLTAFLDLGPSSSWTRMPSDDVSHPEWSLIQISGANYRVEITDGPTAFGAMGEAGTFLEFAFTPSLDSASPTDTLWRIVRWRETGNGDPVP